MRQVIGQQLFDEQPAVDGIHAQIGLVEDGQRRAGCQRHHAAQGCRLPAAHPRRGPFQRHLEPLDQVLGEDRVPVRPEQGAHLEQVARLGPVGEGVGVVAWEDERHPGRDPGVLPGVFPEHAHRAAARVELTRASVRRHAVEEQLRGGAVLEPQEREAAAVACGDALGVHRMGRGHLRINRLSR
jgi:hypothetical protein